LQRGVDHLGDALFFEVTRPVGAQFVAQSLEAIGEIVPVPFTDCELVQAQAFGDRFVRLPPAPARMISVRRTMPCGGVREWTMASSVSIHHPTAAVQAGRDRVA
jgi:hypothetical protein